VIAPHNLMFYRGAKTFPQMERQLLHQRHGGQEPLVRIIFDGDGGAKTAER